MPHGDSEFFPLSHARDKTKKTSFSISSPSSKLNISFISIYIETYYTFKTKKGHNSPPNRRNTFVHLICVANCDTEHSFEPQLILYLYLITLTEVLHSFSMNSPGAMAKRVRSARRRQVLEDPV